MPRRLLACKSHQFRTVGGGTIALTGRTRYGRFDVASTTPSPPFTACAPPWRRLESIATKNGENCRLARLFRHLFGTTVLGLTLAGCGTQITGPAGERDGPGEHRDVSHVPDAVPKVEPKSKYGNPKSYVVFGKRYYTKASARGHVEKGLASWYGKKFHGRRTSSGERYNMYAMTAAHKSLPLPTYAEVTNLDNGRSVVVKVNDRGPFHRGRVIDLSYAAARKLGVVRRGTAMVEVRSIDPRNPNTKKQKKRITEPESAVRVAATSSPARKASSASKKPTRVADDEPAIQIVSNSTPAKSKTARKADRKSVV